MSKSSAVEWATLIIAIVGALAWLPTIVPLFRCQQLYGKVISQYANFGKLPDGAEAAIFLQKVSLLASNKDFFLKEIEIYLKYAGSPQEEKCRPWTWRRLTFTFPEGGRQVPRQLAIDAREYLAHRTVLPHDQAVVAYVSFSSSQLRDEKYEYVKYVLVDFKGKRRDFVVRGVDVRDNQTLFDDDIWR